MTDSSHNSNICPEIPSGPVALLRFIIRISEITSPFSSYYNKILLSVRNVIVGNTLLLIISLHCCEKSH